MKPLPSLWTAAIAGLVSAAATAQPVSYKSRGKAITFPQGQVSFADEVGSFRPGKPAGPPRNSHPSDALGPPDYTGKDERYLTLGCGGALTLRFTDNALVDVAGPDLFVFEIGPDVEPTRLEISADGRTWIEVGRISGGTAAVDIHARAAPGEVYHFVRLTDLKSGCGSGYPGADIDAVGAIGTAISIDLASEVLFDVDKAELKPEARGTLHDAAQRIKRYAGARVVISGHTDDRGAPAHNQVLSERRAAAVRAFFEKEEGITGAETRGWAARRPVVPNDSDANRQRNRRVEISIIPAEAAPQDP